MILFFIRRFNDIDHTVPIVYRLAKDGYKDMAVLALNPDFDLTDDFRLNFLKDECDITVMHVYKFFAPTFIHRFAATFICNTGDACYSIIKQLNNALRFILKGRYTSFFLYRIIFKHLFGDTWSETMLRKKDVRLIVFDWQRLGRFVTLPLTKAAKQLNIPKLAVPHGISMYTNEKWTNVSSSNNQSLDFEDRWKDFDKIIVQFEHYKQTVVNAGVPLEKLTVLGSTRFCREWEDVYQKLVPESNNYHNSSNKNKIKLVFMDHSAQFRTTVDNVVYAVEKLVELDYVELVIKPSTGSRASLSSMKLYDIAKVDFNTPSVNLIKWADVVMGTNSSILLEPLLMGKTFIYPKYFHENNMLWNEMGASWTVHSYAEMEKALQKIAAQPDYRPYTNDNVDKFITTVVYGGIRDRDVLGDHANYILSLI